MPDITISLTPAQAARVAAALKTYTESEVDITIPMVKQFLVKQLVRVVEREERKAAIAAITATPVDLS